MNSKKSPWRLVIGIMSCIWGLYLTLFMMLPLAAAISEYASSPRVLLVVLSAGLACLGSFVLLITGVGYLSDARWKEQGAHLSMLLWTFAIVFGALDLILIPRPFHGYLLFGVIWPVVVFAQSGSPGRTTLPSESATSQDKPFPPPRPSSSPRTRNSARRHPSSRNED